MSNRVRISRTVWSTGLAFSLVGCLAGADPLSELAGPGLKPIQVDKEALRPLAGARPVQFQEFPVLDPNTGKPISPKQMLTLPNGKKIAAGTYYQQLNQYEAALNVFGHSLRENVDHSRGEVGGIESICKGSRRPKTF